jgi:hypothetical protein
MPDIVKQPPDDGSGVPRLYSEDEARRFLRVGTNKWIDEIRGQLDAVLIGKKKFYCADAINAFLRRSTQKARRKVGAA